MHSRTTSATSLKREDNYVGIPEFIIDFITQGDIIRSNATWYEDEEKNNRFFLNLETVLLGKRKIVFGSLQVNMQEKSPTVGLL